MIMTKSASNGAARRTCCTWRKWRACGWRSALLIAALLAAPEQAGAQDQGTVNPQPLPPLAEPDDPGTPAKELFGRKAGPARLQARTIGFYSKGCLAGGVALPINGKTWQVMRLSRNRNWGHPEPGAFPRAAGRAGARRAAGAGSWSATCRSRAAARCSPAIPAIRSGSTPISGSRRCPTASSPAPSARRCRRPWSWRKTALDVDPKVWTPAHVEVIKTAAKDPGVARIFVNAAIKKALCREAGGDRTWLHKVQAWWGHDYHFHVRLRCPSDDAECTPQPPPADRGLRQGARPLVHGSSAASAAVADTAEAEAVAEDGRSARCLPAGPAGAVVRWTPGSRLSSSA